MVITVAHSVAHFEYLCIRERHESMPLKTLVIAQLKKKITNKQKKSVDASQRMGH